MEIRKLCRMCDGLSADTTDAQVIVKVEYSKSATSWRAGVGPPCSALLLIQWTCYCGITNAPHAAEMNELAFSVKSDS